MKTASLFIYTTAIGMIVPALLYAGNSRSFFLGDEAAMTGGAGIAVSRDSGSIWYNPAGLGGLDLGRMELTGTVYSAKLREADKILQASLPSGTYSSDVRADDFGSVPTSLVFVRHGNDKFSYGFAWYQTSDTWLDFRTDLHVPFDDSGLEWLEGLEYHKRSYVYHIGPAFGIQLTPRFRIGASLFFVYGNTKASVSAFIGLTDPDAEPPNDSLSSIRDWESTMDVSLMTMVGIQWEPVDRWHLGVVLRTPTFRVWEYRDGSTIDTEVLAETESFTSIFTYDAETKNEMTFEQKVPMEAEIGLVYKRDKNWIGIEGAVRPPLDKMNQTFLWNASIGGRLALTSVFSWGAGLFTDNSQEKSTDDPLQWKSDRYGITTGLEFKTPLLVKGGSIKKSGGDKDAAQTHSAVKKTEPDRTLTWATTLSLSYSFELAEYKALVVDIETDEAMRIVPEKGIFHQGFIYLGTALYF
jgi:hypothetical protein